MTVTTALYRRYRPDSFADVIGQEHVTEPLMTALRKNRVNHAYLFSGPRGCGKTTSARILARCLNCAQGPTDTPCGTCPSCIELARGGPGSLDVIEIDAASHGGVDDARDLRERATYAPVRDRYKIFIIDEAHMVTSAGFNALLKIVEEPPEHIKFIFATTEPDKVIGTIRSRTHHYPFRLVPPEPLMAYLELLCKQENVPVAPGVLSLVIRAGAGSVRDSLSVLDQLMAGAGTNGLDYELAVALLGYTHASLLDDVVEAIAASDAATVFRAVDRVIQTGHDPRRFVEDLLERFRDLIIVQAMPESAQSILRGMPADQIARMQNQAHNLGPAELSRAADVTNTALTEMTGATSPRLHLELLCARILLPSAEQTERGIAARIDRVERRLNYSGNDVATPAPAVAGPPRENAEVKTAEVRNTETRPAAMPPAAAPAAAPPPTAPGPAPAPAPLPEQLPAQDSPGASPQRPESLSPESLSPDSSSPAASSPAASSRQPERSRPAASSQPAGTATAGPVGSASDVEVLRRAWPDILLALAKIKRSTWALVEPNAQVAQFDGQVLTLAFTTAGLAGAFGRADHSENLRQAIHKTIGIECQIEAVAGGTKSSASSEPNPKAPTKPDTPVTSTDADWGLEPQVASVPSVAAVSPPTPEASGSSTGPAPQEAGRPSIETLREEAPSQEASEPSGGAAGSYSSPADWDAPRDEDAPPLDEEPPMDWVPSTRSSQPAAAMEAPRQAAPSLVPRPQAAATAASSTALSTAPGAPRAAVPADDPWARAREQAPGVWTVDAESNVGSHDPSSLTPDATEHPDAEPAPGSRDKYVPPYEPAAAQVPEPDGLSEPVGVARPVEVRQPVGAMAGSGTSLSAPAIHVAPSPSAAAARQSLYQRLSNSPEAEAGRAKAPARKAEASTVYVHDVPSADDETIEESGVFGRAAVERILGGKLVEERSLDGSPLPPRF